MRELKRRICKLETEKTADEDFQLIIVDETLPDGTMISNGEPVVVRPAKYTLIIHTNPRPT